MTAKQTPTEKALIAMGIEPYAHEDNYPGRADDEALVIRCGRCGGRGIIEMYRPINGGDCFACGGDGIQRHSTVGQERKRDRQEINQMNRNRLRRAKEAEEARKKAEIERAETEAKKAEFLAQHEGLEDALKGLPGDFGVSLRATLNSRGELTQKQVEAALRIAKENAQRQEGQPVPEGREKVTGTIKSEKTVESDYGTTFKMVVEDDRGFRVYGTIPSAILHEVKVGDRVEFTAALKQADGDRTFGFYSRPTKARKI